MAVRAGGLYSNDWDAEQTGDEARLLPVLAVSPAWNGWQRHGKRVIDIGGSLALLILLLPLLTVIAVLIRLDSRGSVIFRQSRCGKDGRIFTFYKFRGMVADAEARQAEFDHLNEAQGPIFKIRNDPRVTRVGRVLRRTSLDELPQLWNVLRGDMSLVGPRPPLPFEVERYESWQHHRLTAGAGMTGLWQVSGRSNLGFDDMVKLDIEYLNRWSLALDLQILVRTLLVVLTAHGAY